MIAFPSSVRVWLSVGRTDMRRYGECLIMRSPGPGVRRVAACRAISLRIIMLLLSIGVQMGLGSACKRDPP